MGSIKNINETYGSFHVTNKECTTHPCSVASIEVNEAYLHQGYNMFQTLLLRKALTHTAKQ